MLYSNHLCDKGLAVQALDGWVAGDLRRDFFGNDKTRAQSYLVRGYRGVCSN